MRQLFYIASFFLFFLGIFAENRAVQAQFSLLGGSSTRIEAEPNKEYYLTDSDGLWFIMAKKFSGDDARKRANQLVYELRKKYKVPAYVYKYDVGANDLTKLSKQIGPQKRTYKYQTAVPAEFAVLVGSFPSNTDPSMQKTLLTIKRSHPDVLKNDPLSQQMVQEFEHLAKKDKEYVGFGPLGKAITVPNPLISSDYFHAKGVVDPFIERMNSDSAYSLLNNPGMYTLRVATFAGNNALKESDWHEKYDRLAFCGTQAAVLCETLRKKGVEAWEFHDRDCSFVTIGSFASYGRDNPDGTKEMDPEIFRLMEQYKGALTGQNGAFETRAIKVTIKNPRAVGLSDSNKPTDLELSFDLQPILIVVPQKQANAAKVIRERKRLEQDQQQIETERMNEMLAINNATHSRHYGQNIPVAENSVAQAQAPISSTGRMPPTNSGSTPNPAGSYSTAAPLAPAYSQTAGYTPNLVGDPRGTATAPTNPPAFAPRPSYAEAATRTATGPVRTATSPTAPPTY